MVNIAGSSLHVLQLAAKVNDRAPEKRETGAEYADDHAADECNDCKIVHFLTLVSWFLYSKSGQLYYACPGSAGATRDLGWG